MRYLFFGLLALGLAACGEPPIETQLALEIGPGDLAPAQSLTANAMLDGKPSPLSFRQPAPPLNRLGVRIAPMYEGLLHLDIQAQDVAACVVWEGTLERQIPTREAVMVMLSRVTPPRCP